MAKLTTKQRKSIPKSEFALPAKKKYPIQDRSHAANAKARAQQQYDKGNISKSTLNKIDAEANKVLKKTEPKKEKLMKGKSKIGYGSKPKSVTIKKVTTKTKMKTPSTNKKVTRKKTSY